MPLRRRKNATAAQAVTATATQPVTAAVQKIDRRDATRQLYSTMYPGFGSPVNVRTRNGCYPWQVELSQYDRHGPGLVGSVGEFVQEKAEHGFQVMAECGTVETDEFTEQVWTKFLLNIKNPHQSHYELVGRIGRLLMLHGEMFLIQLEHNEFYVASVLEMAPTGTGTYQWYHPYTGGIYNLRLGPDTQLFRMWQPDTSISYDPASQWQRALPHLREYIDLRVRSTSDARSRVLVNDIIVFPDGTTLIDDENDPYDGMPEVIADYSEVSKKHRTAPYWERPPISEQTPFPIVGGKPEKIEVGRSLDPNQDKAEELALNAIARSLQCPNAWLVSGAGTGKFDNDNAMLASVITDMVAPIYNMVYAGLVGQVVRPMLRRLKERGMLSNVELDVAVRYRVSAALPVTYRTSEFLMAVEAGVADPTQLERFTGFAPMTDEGLEMLAKFNEAMTPEQPEPELPVVEVAAVEPWKPLELLPVTAAVEDDFSDSVMVAFYPAESYGSVMSPPHVTVVYAGEIGENDIEFDDLRAAFDAVRVDRFSAEVTGQELFGEDEDTWVLTLEHPVLREVRGQFDQYNRSEYTDYQPHLTLNVDGEPLAEPPTNIDIDRIALHWGDQVYIRELPAAQQVAVTAAADPYAELNRQLRDAAQQDRATFRELQTMIESEVERILERLARQRVRGLPSGSELRKAVRDMEPIELLRYLAEQEQQLGFDITAELDGITTKAERILADEYADSPELAFLAASWLAGSVASMFNRLDPNPTPGNVQSVMRVALGQLPERWEDVNPKAAQVLTLAKQDDPTLTETAAVTYTWHHGYYRKPEVPDKRHLSLSGAVVTNEQDFGKYRPGDHPNCTCAVTMKVTLR